MGDDSRVTKIIGDNQDEKQLAVDLSPEDRRKLASPSQISDFQRDKLERNAKKNWDLFYKRNGNRFFKRRYWTRHEFTELFSSDRHHSEKLKYLLEIGCGCGDFALPLLDNEHDQLDNTSTSTTLAEDLFIYCCDISEEAINIFKSNDIYKRWEGSRLCAFVGNLLDLNGIVSNLDGHTMDFVSLIFMLSALDPRTMRAAVDNIGAIVSQGGLLFFRDYAIFDKAMLRFKESNKIQDQFYVRQDGTRAYFFTRSELLDLFRGANFECESIEYVKRETTNKATDQTLSRIFLQAKFRKSTQIRNVV